MEEVLLHFFAQDISKERKERKKDFAKKGKRGEKKRNYEEKKK